MKVTKLCAVAKIVRLVAPVAWFSIIGLPSIPGCLAAGSDSDTTDVLDDALQLNTLGDDPTLCQRLNKRRTQLGKRVSIQGTIYNVIQGTNRDDTINGTSQPDLIFGLAGNDIIYGMEGDDIICAGRGDDFVDGGPGQDRIYGEDGDDILHGGFSGDWIHGGKGNDEIYGDLLDDKLFGDEDNDYLVGGHGTDYMDGGEGSDWLRGDFGRDTFIGGPDDDRGEDTVSFMTARPTGNTKRGGVTVMNITLNNDGIGEAIGDGGDDSSTGLENLKQIERIIGSPFDDIYAGPPDKFISGKNDNRVLSFAYVYIDAQPRDTGLIALGSDSDDRLIFQYLRSQNKKDKDAVLVTETNSRQLYAGPNCHSMQPNVVKCPLDTPLHYLVAWGGGGNDVLRIMNGFPRDFNAHLDGGDGDDQLIGGGSDDLLFSGRSGSDSLHGGGGDDALISQSYAEDKSYAEGRPFGMGGGGPDMLFGGSGNDQLVCDDPCGGHYYSGGDGIDIAGFALVGGRSIYAQLSGPIHKRDRQKLDGQDFYGKAFLPDFCDPGSGTTLEDKNVQHENRKIPDHLEILEGSSGDDHLFGNDRDNIIWGRGGNDTLKGFGGDDILLGQEGDDQLFGGPGKDTEVP